MSQLTLVPGLTTGTITVTVNRAMPDQNRLRGVSHARILSSPLPILALLICGWRSITLPLFVSQTLRHHTESAISQNKTASHRRAALAQINVQYTVVIAVVDRTINHVHP